MIKFTVSYVPFRQYDNMMHAMTVCKPALTARRPLRIHAATVLWQEGIFPCRALSPALQV